MAALPGKVERFLYFYGVNFVVTDYFILILEVKVLATIFTNVLRNPIFVIVNYLIIS